MNQKSPDDLIGRTVGLLRVIGAGQRPAGNRSRHSYLICECVFLRQVRVSRSNLTGFKVLSCGVCKRKNLLTSTPTVSRPSAGPLKFAQTVHNR